MIAASSRIVPSPADRHAPRSRPPPPRYLPAVTPSTTRGTPSSAVSPRSTAEEPIASRPSPGPSAAPGRRRGADEYEYGDDDDDDDDGEHTTTTTEFAPRACLPTPSDRPHRPPDRGAAGGGGGGGETASTSSTPEPRPMHPPLEFSSASVGWAQRRGRGALRNLSGNNDHVDLGSSSAPGASPSPFGLGGVDAAPPKTPALRRWNDATGREGGTAVTVPASTARASIRSPPERTITSSQRIDRIERGLIELELATEPSSSPRGTTAASDDTSAMTAAAGGKRDRRPPSRLFLHALRSMESVVSSSALDDSQRTRSKGRALDALLTTFESVLEEAQRRGQEAEYWSERETEIGRRLKGVMEECVGMRRRMRDMMEEEGRKTTAAVQKRDEERERTAAAGRLRDVSTFTEESELIIDGCDRSTVQSEEPRTAGVENGGDGAARKEGADLPAQHCEQMHVNLRRTICDLETENMALRESLSLMDAAGGAPKFPRADHVPEQSRGPNLLQFANVSLVDTTLGSDPTHPHPSVMMGMGVNGPSDGSVDWRQALASRDGEVAGMTEALAHMSGENERLRRALSERGEELERARRDLSALTRESQAVTSESSRLSGELRGVRGTLEEQVRRADSAEHGVRAAELERNDLLRNYRAACEERQSLERAVEVLSGERSRLGHELALCQEEGRRFQGQCQEWEREVQRGSADASNFERQLDQVSRNGMTVKRTLEAAEAQNRRLREDLAACRRSAGMASAHTVELQQTAARSQHDAEAARGAASGLELERDATIGALEEERRRVEGLESLLSSARAKDAAGAEVTRNLAKENARLKTRLNEATARLKDPPSPLSLLSPQSLSEQGNAAAAQFTTGSLHIIAEVHQRGGTIPDKQVLETFQKEIEDELPTSSGGKNMDINGERGGK